MPEITIIIPIYNVEQYLRECLDSVVNQTLKDIEIICINDGSTDNSLMILEEYAAKDERIKIINQENQGVSAARNVGMKRATSDYIMFVDSDDTIELNTCALSLTKIKKVNADICSFGFNEILKNSRKRRDWGEQKYLMEYENKELDIEAKKAFIINACGKVFRKNFLLKNEIFFGTNIKIGEDAIFNLCCLFNNPKYTVLNAYLYNYLMDRDNSATNCLKNAIKYDIDAHKYFIKTDLFKNAPEYLKIIAIEKFIGETEYFYSKAPEYKFRYFIQISAYYIYLCNIFSPRFLAKVSGLNKINPFKKILRLLFYIGNSPEKTHKIIMILGLRLKFKRNQRKIYQKTLKKNYKFYQKKHNLIIEHLQKEIKTRKLRVCFLVQETQKWNAQSLYDAMEKSDMFEPFVLVTRLMNIDNRNSYEHCIDFFRKRCKNVEIGFDEINNKYIDIKTFSPDIVFYQQPWELHENQNTEYVSDFALPYYFPYAIADAPGCVGSNLENFFITLQKHFIFSDEEEKQYDKKYGYKGYNLLVVGHPKLDIYSDYKEENNQKRFVIYAPHHSLEENSLNYATFKWNGKYILEWAKAHPEFEWVFKPHPRLKEALIENKIMSKKEVEQYYKEWQDVGIYYNDGDYFDIFKNSQCLITDCGSFLTEYLPTKQPVIHLRNLKATDYTTSNLLAMKSYYKAWNINDLETLLNTVLIKRIDSQKSKRLNALRILELDNSNATKKIIKEILEDIQQEAI